MTNAHRNMNPRNVGSTQIMRPINDQDIEGLRVENGVLYRRCIYLLHQDIGLRAALERATGMPWDSENLAELSPEKLDEMVIQRMAHGLNISLEEAQTKIEENKILANPTQVEGYSPNRKTLRAKADESKVSKSRVIPTIKGVPVTDADLQK